MPFLASVRFILNADGTRVDGPNPQGNYGPVDLQLGDGLSCEVTSNGAGSIVTVSAAASDITATAPLALSDEGVLSIGAPIWPADLTETRVVRGPWLGSSTNWFIGAGVAENNSLGKTVSMVLDAESAPHGSRITGVSIGVVGKTDAGRSGVLPGTMPTWDFGTVDSTTGDFVSLISGPRVDPSASLAAFEAAHRLTATGLSIVVDATRYLYVVSFTTEDGANAVVGDTVFLPIISFTRTAGSNVGRD